MINPFNNKLIRYIQYINAIDELLSCKFINSLELSSLACELRYLIKTARKQGANWCWSYDDIRKDSDTCWSLSSVDLIGILPIHNHHELEQYFLKNDIGEYIVWEVESGAWYPCFESREDAERLIDDFNSLLDKLYIDK